MITCSNFLINELDLQIEDLFMYFTVRQLQFLSPAYHVAEISYLRRNNRGLNREKNPNLDIVKKSASTTELKHYVQIPLAKFL